MTKRILAFLTSLMMFFSLFGDSAIIAVQAEGEKELKDGTTYNIGDVIKNSSEVYIVKKDDEAIKVIAESTHPVNAPEPKDGYWVFPDFFENGSNLELLNDPKASENKAVSGIKCTGDGSAENPFVFETVYSDTSGEKKDETTPEGAELTSIALPEKVSTEVGKQTQLTVTYTPENASDKEVTFSSSDEKIATVDASGVVTGVAEGKATITAVSKSKEISALCEVEVVNASAQEDTEKTDEAKIAPKEDANDTKAANDLVTYPVWVGDKQFDSDHLSYQFGEGTATYDPDQKTLTLQNVVINTFSQHGSPSIKSGIYSGLDSLTIQGEGNQNRINPSDEYAHGIYSTGALSLSGSVTMSVRNGDGVYTKDSLTIVNQSLINVYSATRYAIHAYDDIIIDGGTIDATGSFGGIYSSNHLSINRGHVLAKATSSDLGVGIACAKEALTINPMLEIKNPEGGKIVHNTDLNMDYVGDSEGKKALEVEIGPRTTGAFDVWVSGQQVTSENATDILKNGTASFDPETYTLTLKKYIYTGEGHTEHYDFGSVSYDVSAAIITKNTDLTIIIEDNNLIVSTITGSTANVCGVFVAGKLTIKGEGKLSAQVASGQNAEDGSSSFSGVASVKNIEINSGTIIASSDRFGIHSEKNITIVGGTVNAEGDDGIWSETGTVSITGGSVTSKGNDTGVFANEIIIGANISSAISSGTEYAFAKYDNNLHITAGTVKNAVTGTGWETADVSGELIEVSSEGQVLEYQKVQFPADGSYPLWISGSQVTSENKDNIPLPEGSGTASFNSETNTLTLNNAIISSTSVHEEYNCGIYSGLTDLKINAEGTNTITADGDKGNGIYALGNLTLSGSITAKGGDNGIIADGNITIESGSAIFATGNGTETETTHGIGVGTKNNITIKGGTVNAEGRQYGLYSDESISIQGGTTTVHGVGDGIYAYDNLNITGGEVNASSENKIGLLSAHNISIGNAYVTAETKADNQYAIACLNHWGGRIILAQGHAFIHEPVDGTVISGVATQDGIESYIAEPGDTDKPATKVVIKPTQLKYPLWIKGVQVDANHLNDILGDGKASYDPDTHTLTLDGIAINETGDKNAAIYAGSSTEPFDLKIAVKNGAVATIDCPKKNGIVVNGQLTVSGDITISRAEYGIYAPDKKLIIENGNITVNDSRLQSICSKSDILIKGGTVTASSLEECAIESLILEVSITDATVTASSKHSGTAEYPKCGIRGDKITINDSVVTGNSIISYGIYSDQHNIHISNSTVSAETKEGTYAIACDNNGNGIIEMVTSRITRPDGGKLSGDSKYVVEYNGTFPAKKVTIEPDPGTAYNLWVGGKRFYENRKTLSFEHGSATYDPENQSLTFNDLELSGDEYYKITVDGDSYSVYSNLSSDSGPLKLNGTANLNTNADYGIGIYPGSLAVNNTNANIIAKGSKAGVYVYDGSISISGGKLSGVGDVCGVTSTKLEISGGTISGTCHENIAGETYAGIKAQVFNIGNSEHIVVPVGGVIGVHPKGEGTIKTIVKDGDVAKRAVISDATYDYIFASEGDAITATCTNEDCDPEYKVIKLKILPLDTEPLVYDGTEKPATFDADQLQKFNSATGQNISATNITYRRGTEPLTSAPKNAGTYIASITLENVKTGESTTGSVTASAYFTIDKATPTIQDLIFTAPSDCVYNGQNKEAIVNWNSETTPKKEGFGNIDLSYYTGSTKYELAKDCGTYIVKAVTKEGLNFKASTTELTDDSWTFTIRPRAVTVTSGITANNKVYDGDTSAALNTGGAVFDCIVDGDTLTVSGTGTFNDINVGTNKTVTISGLALSGASARNYQLNTVSSQKSTTATITRKPITVSGITANNKIYDGSTSASINTKTAQFDGLVKGDNPPTITVSGTFDNKNVGTGKTVTLKDLTIQTVSNYELAAEGQQTITTADITKKEVRVSNITADPKTYDGTTNAILHCDNAVIDGVLSGDTVTVKSAEGAFSSKNASDSSTVKITTISLSGTDADNYDVSNDSQKTVTGVAINKREVGITWGETSFDYDEQEHVPTATATNVINGDTVTITVKDKQTNAGDYSATASAVDNTNYKLPDDSSKRTTAFTINKVNPAFTIPIPKANLVAKEKTQELLKSLGSATGGSLLYAVTTTNTKPEANAYTFNESNPPSADLSGTYYVWYRVEGDGNHNDLDSETYYVTVLIAQAAPTVTAPEPITDLVYSGTEQALVTEGSTTGGTLKYFVTDTDSSEAPAGEYSTVVPKMTNAGTYYVWYKVDGNETYAGTDPAKTGPITIAKATPTASMFTVTVPESPCNYDGTAKVVTVSTTIAGLGEASLKYYCDDVAVDQPINAGKYVVKLDVTEGINYSEIKDLANAWTFVILPKSVTVSGIKANSKPYDGTNTATLDFSKAVFTGKIDKDELTVTGNGTFTSVDANPNATVQITDLKLGGASVGNYQLAASGNQEFAEAQITKVDPTVTAPTAKLNLTYTGSDQQLLETLGSAEGGSMQYAVTTTNSKPDVSEYTSNLPVKKDAGSYYVWYGVVGDKNHNDRFKDSDFVPVTMTKAIPDASLFTYNAPEGTPSNYDGQKKEATISTTTEGLGNIEIKYYRNGSSDPLSEAKDAGEYQVKVNHSGGDNYQAVSGITADTWKFTINKVPLTVTAKDHTITYGQAPAGNGATYDGFVNGETESVLGGKLDYSFTYKQNQDIGEYKITPKGLTSNNYEISFKEGKLTVTKAPAPASIPDAAKPTANTLTFNEKAQNLVTAPKSPLAGYAIEYSTDGGTTWSSAIPTGTDVGEYEVKARFVADGNHEPLETVLTLKPVMKNAYYVSAGDGQTWTKGSNVTMTVTYKAKTQDDKTYSNFTGLIVDNSEVSTVNYSKQAGSVIITIRPAFLESLSEGAHTITATFANGDAATGKFTVVKKSSGGGSGSGGNSNNNNSSNNNSSYNGRTAPNTYDRGIVHNVISVFVSTMFAAFAAYMLRRFR